MNNNNNSHEESDAKEPNFRFFNIAKISRGSLSRYRTFFQQDEPFVNRNDAPLEEQVQMHFNNMKIDDKEILEKFLKLKKDEGPQAQAKSRPQRVQKPIKLDKQMLVEEERRR